MCWYINVWSTKLLSVPVRTHYLMYLCWMAKNIQRHSIETRHSNSFAVHCFKNIVYTPTEYLMRLLKFMYGSVNSFSYVNGKFCHKVSVVIKRSSFPISLLTLFSVLCFKTDHTLALLKRISMLGLSSEG